VSYGYGLYCIFYTDGSLIEGCAGFAVHQMGVDGFGHKIPTPAGVFTGELSALFTALRHIPEVIRPPERCLILTDSLSSFKAMLSRKIAHQTHPLVYESKQLCWSLCQNGIEVTLMWIPSHVGLVGNKLVDERARQAALEGSIFDRPLSSNERTFQSLARPALMRAWQAKWDSADTGKFAHFIFPNVTLRPWFEGQKEERSFVWN
jgi:ribonuclease HI